VIAKHCFGRVILASLDMGGEWTHVLAHAGEMARITGARLHLVSVVEPPSGGIARRLSRRERNALTGRLAEDTTTQLAKAAASAGKGIEASTRVRAGRPADEILAEQAEVGAGLVVVGARAMAGLPTLVLRTTPDRVLRASPAPVLAVGPGSARVHKRILVPVDFDRPSLGCTNLAFRLAAAHRARVSLLHVFAQPSPLRLYSGDIGKLGREIRAEARARLDEFVAKLALPEGTKPPHKLLAGTLETVQAAETIVGEAARLRMDLIVMSRGEHSALHRIFIGSTAERVIRQLPCSLLILPSEWARRR
jgi:nucleotide-binding universal stress UspA family protein